MHFNPPFTATYRDERKVDTPKNAEKGTFEVSNLELLMKCLVLIERENIAHTKFSDKNDMFEPPYFSYSAYPTTPESSAGHPHA